MPKVSEQHKAEVRDRLLDAAQDAIRELGIDKASTRDWLERAGLSFGSLYHYFPGGKDEILLALAERIFTADLSSLLPDDIAPGTDVADVAVQLLAGLFAPGTRSLLPQLRPRAAHDPGLRRALSQWDQLTVEALAKIVTAAQEDGLLRSDFDGRALVEVIIVFFEGLKTREAAGCFATDYGRVVSTFLYVLGGAAQEPAEPGELRGRLEGLAQQRAQPRS